MTNSSLEAISLLFETKGIGDREFIYFEQIRERQEKRANYSGLFSKLSSQTILSCFLVLHSINFRLLVFKNLVHL